NRDMCALLLDYGADPNKTSVAACSVVTETRNPLMMAAERGHVEVVELLLERGAVVTSGVLRSAARSKRPDVLRLVLEQDIDTDNIALDIRAALNYVCLHGLQEMV